MFFCYILLFLKFVFVVHIHISWISIDISSGFQSKRVFRLFHTVGANVMHILRDPPLDLHIGNLLTVSIVGH